MGGRYMGLMSHIIYNIRGYVGKKTLMQLINPLDFKGNSTNLLDMLFRAGHSNTRRSNNPSMQSVVLKFSRRFLKIQEPLTQGTNLLGVVGVKLANN